MIRAVEKVKFYYKLLKPSRRGTFWMEVAKNSHFNFRHFSYDILHTTCYSHYINPSGKHKYILVSARKIDTFDRGDFV